MKKRISIVCLMSIISASILLTHRNAIAEVVIIVNKSVSIDTMSQSTISNIYFGNMTKWPDGKTIHVVMLKGGKTHETYVKKILVSTPSRLISYWKKVVFTGIGIRPKIFKNEQDLVSYVSNTKGTIGYIDDSVLDESVKVVTIIQ